MSTATIAVLQLSDAKEMSEELSRLQQEMGIVLQYTVTLRASHPLHFPNTSYGYAMCLFSKIDLFSQYWFPQVAPQTDRMKEFLVQCLGYGPQETLVAIKMWRHGLMHTSQPRVLVDQVSGQRYDWLLQHQLPQTKHWVLEPGDEKMILNLGLMNLAEDLKTGFGKIVADLPNRADILGSWAGVSSRIRQF
ncbi:MAG: hypothetical protein M3P27_05425 [Acidobacteriota bacterium]|nr:hypothetical protein [Acidobacteriota bacterium]